MFVFLVMLNGMFIPRHIITMITGYAYVLMLASMVSAQIIPIPRYVVTLVTRKPDKVVFHLFVQTQALVTCKHVAALVAGEVSAALLVNPLSVASQRSDGFAREDAILT